MESLRREPLSAMEELIQLHFVTQFQFLQHGTL